MSAMPTPPHGHDDHFTHPERPAQAAQPQTAPDTDGAAPNRALYNRLTMAAYTTLVIHGSHRRLWGIDNEIIHALYQRHTGPAHVDVGVGNGHFLRRAATRSARIQRAELIDLNPAPLQVTAGRLRRHIPCVTTHTADALRRWPLADASVDSVGSTMMLHTLPGDSYHDKHTVFTEAARVLRPKGVFFGTSVLGEADPAPISSAGARMRRLYNDRRNVFHNTGDTAHDLRHLLASAFGPTAKVHVRTVGATAVWEVTKR